MQMEDDAIIAYESTVRKTCFYSNLIFFICHLAYLLFFFLTGVYILAWVNVGSAILYAFMFLLVKYEKYGIYAVISGAEITAIMTFSTAMCGFQAGFHLCLIGLCVLVYFSGYFSVQKTRIIRPQYWCLMLLALYIFLYFYCLFNPPVYDLSNWVKSFLFVAHVLIVFGFITIFLYVFVRYVLKLEKRIKTESRTDKLTQVANRYGLIEYVEALDDKNNYYLSIFDIDDFKLVNDEHGHICGDHMLFEIAEIAKNNSLDDFVSRFGGEEFVVITRIDDNALNKIEDIRRKIEEHVFNFNNLNLHATVTIGVSKYDEGMSIDDWIMKADKRLYDGKTSGKNKVVF